jgi:hypothetical protein
MLIVGLHNSVEVTHMGTALGQDHGALPEDIVVTASSR